jgi:hypothetical protein
MATLMCLVALSLLASTASAWSNAAAVSSASHCNTACSIKRAAVAMTAEKSPVQGYSVVLLAGGVGSRMKAGKPKQFLELRGKPVLQHTLDLFLDLDGVKQVACRKKLLPSRKLELCDGWLFVGGSRDC